MYVTMGEKVEGVVPLVQTFGHDGPQFESVHAPR